jgi:hypothetical protein
MRILWGTLVLLWLMPPFSAAYGADNVDWLNPIMEPLVAVGRLEAKDLTAAQIAAAEALCRLSESYRPAIVAAIKSRRMGGFVFAAADWHFRNQYLDKACLLYELALEDFNNFGDHPVLCDTMAQTARYRATLCRDHRDFGSEPLRLYAQAIGGGDPLLKRQMLRQITELYPKSKMIDDVDFALGIELYPPNRPELARYWEEFLKTHPDSPLQNEVDRRLTIVYYNLGVRATAEDEPEAAARWFRLVVDRPAVLDSYAYRMIAEFFESRGELALAEQAYIKGVDGALPDHGALALFYERHYGLGAYIKFLLDRGAGEDEIQRRLNKLEEMRAENESKQGAT